MADNIAITAGAGTSIATDDVAGVHYQRVKLVDGTLDGTDAIPGTAANGLDVDVTRLPALPAGTNNIGDVDVLTLPAIPAGTNNIGDVDVLTMPDVVAVGKAADGAAVSGNPVLVAGQDGTNTQSLKTDSLGRLELGSGTNNIGDVDVLTLPALPAGANNIGDVDVITDPFSLVDDAAFTPATSRVVPSGAVFDDTTPDSVNEGDIGAVRMSSRRELYIQIRDAEGNERGAKVNASGELLVTGGSGVSDGITDDSPFTVGTTKAVPIAAMLDDTAADSVDEGDVGVVRMSPSRALHVMLKNSADQDAGTTTFPLHVQGSAADGTALGSVGKPVLIAGQDGANQQSIKTDSDGELQVDVLTMPAVAVLGTDTYTEATSKGLIAGAVRRDADTTLVGTTNEIAPLQVDANGALKVEIFDGGASHTVDAPIGTPVNVQIGNGTLAAGVIDETGASAVDALAVGGGTAHDAADSGNPLKVGGKANLNEPTAVAENDRVNAWHDLIGRQVVLTGHANPEPPVTVNGSAAGLSVIGTPGASLSLYICKGSMHNAGVEQVVSLRDGAAGTIRFTANLAADGGGTIFDFGSRGWKLTADTALVADIAAATVYINITEYYIAA